MGRRRVEIEVVFFRIFPVIPFIPGQTEHPFFENRISSIPEGQRETDELMPIADSGKAVFIPPIGFRAGMVVRKPLPKPFHTGCNLPGLFPTRAH